MLGEPLASARGTKTLSDRRNGLLHCMCCYDLNMRSPEEFNDSGIPMGYLITFRTFGTWLHGDRRGSVDRFHNVYGTPMLHPNPSRELYEQHLMKMPPVKLDTRRRAAVLQSLRETCRVRKWKLWAANVRTNHVHSVITAQCRALNVLQVLKAHATRTMKKNGCWAGKRSPWAYRGSRKKLWTEKDLMEAIVYVEYGQGEPLP
jgi:REP element-mobilizing transposase RayT